MQHLTLVYAIFSEISVSRRDHPFDTRDIIFFSRLSSPLQAEISSSTIIFSFLPLFLRVSEKSPKSPKSLRKYIDDGILSDLLLFSFSPFFFFTNDSYKIRRKESEKSNSFFSRNSSATEILFRKKIQEPMPRNPLLVNISPTPCCGGIG